MIYLRRFATVSSVSPRFFRDMCLPIYVSNNIYCKTEDVNGLTRRSGEASSATPRHCKIASSVSGVKGALQLLSKHHG